MVDRLREDPYAAMLAARQALENDTRWARRQPALKGTAFRTRLGGSYADMYIRRYSVTVFLVRYCWGGAWPWSTLRSGQDAVLTEDPFLSLTTV